MIMEMISIPRNEYDRMRIKLAVLRELEKVDFDLLRQFKQSLEDVRVGRIKRVA